MVRSRLFDAAYWILGLVAGAYAVFHTGPQMQCAADPSCAWDRDRWRNAPLVLLITVELGLSDAFARRRFLGRAG